MLKYCYLLNINKKTLNFQASWYKNKIIFKSTQIQRFFNVECYRWINVDKSTLNQRGYHVDQRRDVIYIYQPWINVECFLGCGWVFIYARSLENCISVEGFNTLNTSLQSVLQNIKSLQSAKQGPFSLMSEAAVQINFAVNLARFLKTSI